MLSVSKTLPKNCIQGNRYLRIANSRNQSGKFNVTWVNMASDVFYCILFAFAAIVVGIHGISQSKYEKTNNVLYMKQNVAIESHSRKRRDVGGTEHNFTDFHFKVSASKKTRFLSHLHILLLLSLFC